MKALFRVRTVARRLRNSRGGQDLIEYALATGFVAVAATAFFPSAIAPTIGGIMGRASDLLIQSAGS